MTLKPLGKLKEVVEAAGMGISYAYDDLVFLDHNAFLMQFGDDNRTVILHTNSKADQKEADEGIGKLKIAAQSSDLNFAVGGFYTLSQVEDYSIAIEFHE